MEAKSSTGSSRFDKIDNRLNSANWLRQLFGFLFTGAAAEFVLFV